MDAGGNVSPVCERIRLGVIIIVMVLGLLRIDPTLGFPRGVRGPGPRLLTWRACAINCNRAITRSPMDLLGEHVHGIAWIMSDLGIEPCNSAGLLADLGRVSWSRWTSRCVPGARRSDVVSSPFLLTMIRYPVEVEASLRLRSDNV